MTDEGVSSVIREGGNYVDTAPNVRRGACHIVKHSIYSHSTLGKADTKQFLIISKRSFTGIPPPVSH